jgi:ABC-2 type transport system permease protein
MNVTQVFKIARREYLARVRSRAFILVTVLVPLFLGAYLFAAPMLMRSSSATVRFAILDDGAGMGAALAARLKAIERPRVEITEVTPADAAARERLNTALLARTLDGYFVVASQPDGQPSVRYYARVAGNSALTRELRAAAQSAALDTLLAGTGIDPEEARTAQRLPLTVVAVTDRGEREGGFETALISTMTLAMLLYMAVLINGQGMAMAIVEEKSSRLIEVILSARPRPSSWRARSPAFWPPG